MAIMAANTPEMLEAHYGLPMLGGALNSLNIRHDAATIAFILNHGEAKALLVDREYSPVAREVLMQLDRAILVVDIEDPLEEGGGRSYAVLRSEEDPGIGLAFPTPGPRPNIICNP